MAEQMLNDLPLKIFGGNSPPSITWRKLQMKKTNVGIEECANYLIQLFYKTEKRYSCTRTKIGKLLSILAFKYAVQDEISIFPWEIYRYPKCGTSIAWLNTCIDRDVYLNYPYVDSKKRISKKELNENVDIPNGYKEISNLLSRIKNDIEDVFFAFGAYSQVDLSEELNPIVEYEGICLPNGMINLDNLIVLQDKFMGNKVLDYVFNR